MPFDRLVPLALAAALAGCGSVGAIGVGPMQTKPGQEVELAGGLPPAVPSGQAADGSARPAAPARPLPAWRRTAMWLPPPRRRRRPCRWRARPHRPPRRLDHRLGWRLVPAVHDPDQLDRRLPRLDPRLQQRHLKSISAWNLDGKSVVLAGSGGAPVAHLSSSGNNRFDGQTDGGATPVTFYR